EIFDTNPENPRALLGGGRYDGLVALFGGEPIPAIGFAVGIETLVDFLTTHNLLPRVPSAPTLFIGTPTVDDQFLAQKFADTLRTQGVSVIVNSSTKGLGDQIKDAVRRKIPFFVAYGKDEERKKKVLLKNLVLENAKPVATKKLAEALQKSSKA
ncbi:MAG: ATP phosphoribosyltransferase regulatory subunit, partial [Candidatus Pacebacteria bacterium]|nr:ATP phosphoribosyltransferase regulatory subunit [Candidatus Paceibacterota bacterium]